MAARAKARIATKNILSPMHAALTHVEHWYNMAIEGGVDMNRFFCILVCAALLFIISGCVNNSLVDRDSAVSTSSVPIEEHSYTKEVTVPATCTQVGEVTYTCETCGDKYTEEIPQIPHVGEEKITIEPTLIENGEKEITCSMCGGTFTEIILPLGTLSSSPYEIKASSLYKDVAKEKTEQYQNKYLAVSGSVVYISDYGDLKGYYLYGSIGQGVVCWVNGNTLIANTGSDVVFVGRADNFGIDHIELTNCSIIGDVDVSEEPGLTRETAVEIALNDISNLYTNKWISFDGKIIGKVPYGDDVWYYLDGDIACLSSEVHSVGDSVNWTGIMISEGELWATIIDCETLSSE